MDVDLLPKVDAAEIARSHELVEKASKGSSDIVAIVCAYDEARQINDVLRVLTTCKQFREVIVVDDGSRDSTAEQVTRCFPAVRLIRHELNRGKGHAMDTAVKACAPTDEIFFFCDADIVGLSSKLIDDLIEPVASGRKSMMIAQRHSGFYSLPLVLSFAPKLGGIRAVRREVWDIVPSIYKQRFQIEAALNYFSGRFADGFGYRIARELSQVIKESKYGFLSGFIARMKMCWQVATAILRLQIFEKTAIADNLEEVVTDSIQPSPDPHRVSRAARREA